MEIYDAYGFRNDSIRNVATELESLLGVKFMAHSTSEGLTHYMTKEQVFKIKLNRLDANDWIEDEHKDYNIIVYVNNAPNPDLLLRKLLENRLGCIPLYRVEIISEEKLARIYSYINGGFVMKAEKAIKCPPRLK